MQTVMQVSWDQLCVFPLVGGDLGCNKREGTIYQTTKTVDFFVCHLLDTEK